MYAVRCSAGRRPSVEAATLISELKRRRVFRVLIGYGIAAFAVLQIIEPVMHGLHWPDAVLSFTVVALAAGFPIVVAVAWVFDVKAGTIQRTPPTATKIRGIRLTLLLVAIGVFAAAPGLLWYLVWHKSTGSGTARTTTPVPGEPHRRPVPIGSSPSRGPADAPVTIAEFSDFQCPFSKQAEPILQKLFDKYPDKIRLVWKDEPLAIHVDADDAASLAREALRQKGPGAYWRVHDKLMASAPLGNAVLERIAAEEGLAAAEVSTTLRSGRYRSAIDADVDVAYAIGVGGTPWFFVNGREVVGEPAEALEKVVAEELADARRRIAAGVTAAALYEEIQREAHATPIKRERVNLPDPGRRPARGGPAQSALLVHEFCDLLVAKCAWIEPLLRKTLASYGDEVRLVWWDVSDPQQETSVRLMSAATATGNDTFWKMHDAILAMVKRQWDEWPRKPAPETPSPAVLRQLAQDMGVDVRLYDYAVVFGLHADERKRVAEARTLGR